MSDTSPCFKFSIIVLAAGESSRMGRPKQLLSYRGKPLLRHAVETVLPLGGKSVVVVLGAFAEAIGEAVSDLPVRLVENSDWRMGMGTSIASGMRELLRTDPDLDGVLMLLCDQPLISAHALKFLIAAGRSNQGSIIAAEYAGTLGVPALFSRALFPELLVLEGQKGARAVIEKHLGVTAAVAMPEAAYDVDTHADFAALEQRGASS